MQLFNTKTKLANHLKRVRGKNKVGFVPTMGSLHEGHLSLIKESKRICKITICSIFINPTQFNNSKDLENYPRKFQDDLNLLDKVKCDIVYMPENSDLYENNEKGKKYNFGALTNSMEAKHRPGHFNGVATIVEKFFHIITPTQAFFGEKDLQQLQVVKALVKQMGISTEIISMPTIRDQNGLARSSRNILLSAKDKKDASQIYSSLLYCKKNKKEGIEKLNQYIYNTINYDKNIKLEYVHFININNLQRIKEWGEEGTNAICIAAYVSQVRLIDNIIL